MLFFSFMSPVANAYENALSERDLGEGSLTYIEEKPLNTDSISWYFENKGKPSGVTSINTPFITHRVIITGDEPYKLRMLLDGVQVNADYDRNTGILSYQTGKLAGKHIVAVEIEVYGKTYHFTSWEFLIDPTPVDPFIGTNHLLLSTIQQETVTRMNGYRNALSLPMFSVSESLQKAAQAHSNYLSAYPSAGHKETPNTPGFTGENPWDRSAYFGFMGSVGEGITYQKETGALGVDDLMDAPYHRLSIIDPENTLAGVGYNDRGDITIKYGDLVSPTESEKIVLYPYHQQMDAKVSWYVAENPNPLRFWGIDKEFVGYPISYAYFPNDREEVLNVTSLSLTNRQGEAVAFYDVTPERETEGKHHVFLIPKSPLKPGETYHVQVKAFVENAKGQQVDVSRSWSFKTSLHIDVQDLYFMKSGNMNFIRAALNSGEDPNAKIKVEQNGQLYIEGEKTKQWSYKEITAGDYIVAIESPLFNVRKEIPVTIQPNDTPRRIGSGDWKIIMKEDISDLKAPIIESITNVSTVVKGQAKAGTTVSMKLSNGEVRTAVVSANGQFTIPINAQNYDTVLEFFVSNHQGVTSEITKVLVMDVVGQSHYIDWTPEQTVEKEKDWTIRFNQEIDLTTVNENTIYVHQNRKKVEDIEILVNADGKSLTVKAPRANYQVGQTYFLYIEDQVKSKKDQSISKPIKFKFMIQ